MSRDVLSQLRSGQLQGQTKVTIAAGLTEFPRGILDLADSLEVLDLSRNQLRSLPDDFDRLQNLKILFVSNNEFEHLPAVLGRCAQLSMVGFKANRIRVVPAESLPPLLRWLILTDNQIEQLPGSIGKCDRLQKLMLAGNQLRSLPEEIQNCQNLELVRLAANRFENLEAVPEWLFELPKLSWLGLGGIGQRDEPVLHPELHPELHPVLQEIPWEALTIGKKLGEGASGIISQAVWQRDGAPIDVAVKVFKGAVTSDGLPIDEMKACIAAGIHDHLIGVLGRVIDHPEQRLGFVLPLLDRSFEILGNPPSFESCTRDTFADDRTFEPEFILRVTQGIAAAAAHLHDRGILHGDLYAHNILVNQAGDAVLSDFGAASFYPVGKTAGHGFEALEVRAFGCLLEDLLDRCDDKNRMPKPIAEAISMLKHLQRECLQPSPIDRPRFSEICQRLGDAMQEFILQ
jgi:hypothetical protein